MADILKWHLKFELIQFGIPQSCTWETHKKTVKEHTKAFLLQSLLVETKVLSQMHEHSDFHIY